jgi:hypothetical protein
MESEDNNITNKVTNTATSTLPRRQANNWAPLKTQQKLARKVMLDQAAQMYIDAQNSHDGINVPPSTFQQITATFGNPSWMNRHSIFYHYKNNFINKNVINTTEIESISDLSSFTERNKGGRPSSATTIAIDEWQSKIKAAKVIAAEKYVEAKATAQVLAKGTLDQIIRDSVLSVDLPVDNVKYIPKKTIESRVVRKNTKGVEGSFSQSSPMALIEPMLAEFCRHLNRMAKSIGPTEFLALAHDIVVDTPTSERTKSFQKIICGVSNKSQQLGKKYFYNFMKRHKNIVHTTKVHKQCVSRLEWATFLNIEKMYDLVYNEMVCCGVATKLNAPVYFNKNNEIVNSDDDSKVGTLSDVMVNDPSYILFVDETGSSTNMINDKHGNKKVIAEKGFGGTKSAITSDLRYTTMGFTAATGQPVMCVIFLVVKAPREYQEIG